MKVCIANKYGTWENRNTGKAFFIARLIPELRNLGVDVTADHQETADIHLGIGKFLYKPKSGKRVLRLGPCHFNKKEDWKTLNKRKADAVRKADGVIYQSQWSRKVCHKFLGRNEVEAVIFNGSDMDREIKLPGRIYEKKWKFVAGTRTWLPQKRMKAIIKAWTLADINDSSLIIMGNVEKKYSGVRKIISQNHFGGPEKKTRLAGPLDQWEIWVELNRPNTIFVDVTHLGACPNSVVEALTAGCRIICGSEGGTHELVQNNGIIIPDKPWDFKPIDLDRPPKLNVERLAEAMCMEAVEGRPEVDASHVDIRNIAGKYKKFFEEVLGA